MGTYFLSVEGQFCAPEPVKLRVFGYPDMPESITGPWAICRGIPHEYMAGTIDADHIFTWSINNATLNTTVGEVTEVTLSNTLGTYPFRLYVSREMKTKPYCRSDAREKEINQPIVIFDIYGKDTVCPSQYANYETLYDQGEEYVWSIYPHTMGSVEVGQGTKTARILWNKQPGAAKLVCRIAKCYNAYSYDTFNVYIRPLELNITVDNDTICMTQHSFAHVNVATSGVHWDDGQHSYFGDRGDESLLLTYADEPLKNYTKYYITASVDSPYGCPSPIYAKDSIIVTPSPYVRLSERHIYKDCNPWSRLVTTSWDTAGIPPTSYQWSFDGVPLSTDSFYTVTGRGVYKLEVGGSFGCPATHEVKVTNRCDSTLGGGSGGTWYPPGDPCPSRDVRITIDWGGTCDTTISVTRILPTIHSFTGGMWPPSTEMLRLNKYTDSTAEYTPLRAGVHQISYRAFYSDGNGGTCTYIPDTFLNVPLVVRLEVTPLCHDSVDGTTSYRYLRYVNRSTSIEPVIKTVYWQRLGTGNVFAEVNRNVDSFEKASLVRSTSTLPKQFRLMVATAHDSCLLEMPLFFGILPKADFGFVRDSTCEKDAEVLFDNQTVPPARNMTSLWDFEDQSQNDQENPSRVFNDPRVYFVKLKVTDRWGCPDSTTKIVPIVARQINGDVLISPDFPCQFDIATAEYRNSGVNVPNHWEWYDKDTKRIGGGNYQWDVTRSGYYYARVRDKYGCTHTAQGDTVQFIKVPRAFISGDEGQCAGIPFSLSGYAGKVPGLTYSWQVNGSTISGATKADLEQTISTAGTYYYQVTTTVPNPGGGTCSDISDSFKVVVRNNPDPPTISFTVLDCDNYTLELVPVTGKSGHYNWSNGMPDSVIQVHHGGPYQVVFTDVNGCESKERIQTPRDLRVYLWSFPTGCYSLCYTDANILTGPIMYFEQWDYLFNGSSFHGGTSGGGSPYFSNVSLNGTGPGYYQMYLQNQYCNITSDTMDVDYDCRPGGPGAKGTGMKPSAVRDLVSAPPMLQLAPNPAQGHTQVSYHYNTNGGRASVEVYDVLGRVVFGRQLQAATGNFSIDLQHFATGNYRVVLRQAGSILQHSQLSVTH